MIKLVFIGDNFYVKSGSIMSSIYEEGSGRRYDWGFVERDLAAGKEIHIRQATPEEKLAAYEYLEEITGR